MELPKLLKSKGLTCAIPYTKVGDMLRMVSETAADDRERAISFCGGPHQLSFPSAIGEVGGVTPPECPASKEKIGTFHTHRLLEEELPEKSMEDWFLDVEEGTQVSCLGFPQIEVSDEGDVFQQRTITCHTFQKNHPEYKDFRDRLFLASFDAMAYEDEVATIMASRDLTPKERAKYWEYKDKVNALLEEGKSKGILTPCVPKVDEEFSLPDVEAMLAEQKHSRYPKVKPSFLRIKWL